MVASGGLDHEGGGGSGGPGEGSAVGWSSALVSDV